LFIPLVDLEVDVTIQLTFWTDAWPFQEDLLTTLKPSQKKYLRGLANSLKPIVFIGKGGLTSQVFDAIDEALQKHELIKVKFLEFKDDKEKLSREIEEKGHCILAGMIGHVAIFYRQHPDKEKRKVQLP